jgi:hypothetical protein
MVPRLNSEQPMISSTERLTTSLVPLIQIIVLCFSGRTSSIFSLCLAQKKRYPVSVKLKVCNEAHSRSILADFLTEISSEIVVYRYSQRKFVDYLRAKVAHLQNSLAFDGSQTLTRNLAKEGLMEDGKEELLTRALYLMFHSRQLG